ncbi:CLUMA_CG020817, isoform A [Clunio marinus]|uniref:CLUMA_CG020817, isoform A n=1 Tax=Clunio marinus TaxID=568069 RepID=A0A1J1J642_9DIPT|nr:CLUMA_CG020817, isoform A [Clunio marinus]
MDSHHLASRSTKIYDFVNFLTETLERFKCLHTRETTALLYNTKAAEGIHSHESKQHQDTTRGTTRDEVKKRKERRKKIHKQKTKE